MSLEIGEIEVEIGEVEVEIEEENEVNMGRE